MFYCLSRSISSLVIPSCRRLLRHRSDSVWRSGLKVYASLIRVLGPIAGELGDQWPAMVHEDLLPHIHVFEDLDHLQKHKRNREGDTLRINDVATQEKYEHALSAGFFKSR